MVAAMRAVLASSALVIIYLDPSEPDRLVSLTYAALVIYTLYSVLLVVLSIWRQKLVESGEKWFHWVDVCCYLIVISLSSGTSSVFFFFFFFPILVSSFRWGFASGLRVVIASSVLFSIVGYATAPAGPQFELNRFLLRPIYLLVLGYMVAYWGGHEVMLKRRLALLKELTQISNPRFGMDRTIGKIMSRLRAFYGADRALIILPDTHTGRLLLRQSASDSIEAEAHPVGPEMERLLLYFSPECAIVCARAKSSRGYRTMYRYPPAATVEDARRLEDAIDLAVTLLDAPSFMTAPIRYRQRTVGRVYVTSHKARAFNRSDAGFLAHLFEQVMPAIENIKLVDRLASEAAEQERQRIARDIHDSVIQPYIGLKLGLTAAEQKLASGGEVTAEIRRLIELSDAAIEDLRQYVSGLRESVKQGDSLVSSIRRYAGRFEEATGITISVESAPGPRVNDRLAAEVFQMIAEGLSNIRRHTDSRTGAVKITFLNDQLVLTIENDGADPVIPPKFIPRSISDRTASLGGSVRVEHDTNGRTAVIAEVPL
jgi:signal transduction histidine kinase